MTAYKMHDIDGSPEVNFMLDLQDQVQLFPETELALQEQQDMGVNEQKLNTVALLLTSG